MEKYPNAKLVGKTTSKGLVFEVEDKKFREKDTNTSEFWLPILKQKSFREFVENKYRVAAGEILQESIDETFDVETTNGVN